MNWLIPFLLLFLQENQLPVLCVFSLLAAVTSLSLFEVFWGWSCQIYNTLFKPLVTEKLTLVLDWEEDGREWAALY